MRVAIPRSLSLEHEELKHFLLAAGREEGRLGEAMRKVARLLEPHCRKEESFALPPLGLLPRLARGELSAGMAEVLPHCDWLKRNVATLAAEHRMISAAAEELLEAAREGRRIDCVEFAERLLNHARLEEEVIYPAAILVGEYLRLTIENPV